MPQNMPKNELFRLSALRDFLYTLRAFWVPLITPYPSDILNVSKLSGKYLYFHFPHMLVMVARIALKLTCLFIIVSLPPPNFDGKNLAVFWKE